MTVLCVAPQEEAAAKARAEADEMRRSLEEAAAKRRGLEEVAAKDAVKHAAPRKSVFSKGMHPDPEPCRVPNPAPLLSTVSQKSTLSS